MVLSDDLTETTLGTLGALSSAEDASSSIFALPSDDISLIASPGEFCKGLLKLIGRDILLREDTASTGGIKDLVVLSPISVRFVDAVDETFPLVVLGHRW